MPLVTEVRLCYSHIVLKRDVKLQLTGTEVELGPHHFVLAPL